MAKIQLDVEESTPATICDQHNLIIRPLPEGGLLVLDQCHVLFLCLQHIFSFSLLYSVRTRWLISPKGGAANFCNRQDWYICFIRIMFLTAILCKI